MQELPPFTTPTFSQSFCLCAFGVAIVEHLNECLKLLGAVFCPKLDLLFCLLLDICLPKCLKTSFGICFTWKKK